MKRQWIKAQQADEDEDLPKWTGKRLPFDKLVPVKSFKFDEEETLTDESVSDL